MTNTNLSIIERLTQIENVLGSIVALALEQPEQIDYQTLSQFQNYITEVQNNERMD